MNAPTPVLEARGLVKRFGQVVALNDTDFDLFPNEITAIIGDNGAGKSTLIKVLSGAFQPDDGELLLDGERVRFRSPLDARRVGIETVYQELAVAPALDIAANIFLGRELRRGGPAGGLRQGVAVARAAAWGKRLVIMDEPTAALGVKETRQVLDLILRVRERGLPVILISHDMPHVFELADRIQIMRLGRRVAVVTPRTHSMPEAVAIMTGATRVELERTLTKEES